MLHNGTIIDQVHNGVVVPWYSKAWNTVVEVTTTVFKGVLDFFELFNSFLITKIATAYCAVGMFIAVLFSNLGMFFMASVGIHIAASGLVLLYFMFLFTCAFKLIEGAINGLHVFNTRRSA